MAERTVPCNGCTRCCHRDAVRLMPYEERRYQAVPHPLMAGKYMLDHKPNGDCVYLSQEGCSIHDTRPQQCREMDCRGLAARITYTQARKLDKAGRFPMTVWRKGRELLKKYNEEQR